MFLQAGIVHLQWEDSSSVVSTCSLDGALRLWDARSGSIVSEYRGHTAEILDFAINRYHFATTLPVENVPACKYNVALVSKQRQRIVDFSVDRRPAPSISSSGKRLSRSPLQETTRPKCSASKDPIGKDSRKKGGGKKRRGNISGEIAETFDDQTFCSLKLENVFPFASGF